MANQKGYGESDAKLAARLDGAPTKAEADAEAKRDGLKDAADAGDWLASRS